MRTAHRRWLPGGLRLPRRTVRLRLTLLYGVLFLVSAAGLLLLTNVLVRQATDEIMLFQSGEQAEAGARVAFRADGTPVRIEEPPDSSGRTVVRLLEEQAAEFRAAQLAQREAERRQLLIQSGVALGVMAFVAIGLGWIVAGRALRPLRTITATAREISATNLHRRLALDGPDDELKELGDTVDDLLERLERAFEAQRQFVANASHELRTPLARQRTLIEVALTDPEATADSLRASHQRVLAASEEQDRLIEALLTLARSERGFDRGEPLQLATITTEVLAAFRPEVDVRALTLTSDLHPAPIVGDRALMERMVANLIDNAIRHNRPDGDIDVTTGTHAGRSFLLVSNAGPEIRAEEVEALLQPFRRHGQDRVRQRDGHGLGLSIVRAVAEAHGATLSLRPLPGGGLRVEVRFPAVVPGEGTRGSGP